MAWMQRLKRVFNIDNEVFEHGGGEVKVIAYIEDPKVISRFYRSKPNLFGAIWAPACLSRRDLEEGEWVWEFQ